MFDPVRVSAGWMTGLGCEPVLLLKFLNGSLGNCVTGSGGVAQDSMWLFSSLLPLKRPSVHRVCNQCFEEGCLFDCACV